jgi:hypothetical protein
MVMPKMVKGGIIPSGFSKRPTITAHDSAAPPEYDEQQL